MINLLTRWRSCIIKILYLDIFQDLNFRWHIQTKAQLLTLISNGSYIYSKNLRNPSENDFCLKVLKEWHFIISHILKHFILLKFCPICFHNFLNVKIHFFDQWLKLYFSLNAQADIQITLLCSTVISWNHRNALNFAVQTFKTIRL